MRFRPTQVHKTVKYVVHTDLTTTPSVDPNCMKQYDGDNLFSGSRPLVHHSHFQRGHQELHHLHAGCDGTQTGQKGARLLLLMS